MKNTNEISIAVIIPIYNSERWIQDCLESVVNQTIKFKEVIIVNDGSDDNSAKICEDYCKRYSNIKLFHVTHKGAGAARNKGMKETKADYVMFLDSDDMLSVNTVERLINALSKEHYNVLYFEGDLFGEEELIDKWCDYRRTSMIPDNTCFTGRYFFDITYPSDYFESACMAVYEREYVRNSGGEFLEGVMYEDNYYTFSLMYNAPIVGCIHEQLYRRRLRANSVMTSQYNIKRWHDFVYVTEKIRGCANGIVDGGLTEKLKEYFISRYEIIYRDYSIIADEDVDSNELQLALDGFLRMLIIDSDKYDTWNTESLVKGWKLIVGFDVFRNRNIIQERIKRSYSKALKNRYKKILSKLPCNRGVIAIYGCGKHTEGMLRLYENMIGNIKAHLVYIETKDKGNIFRKKIVHDAAFLIKHRVDDVIVSSFYYRNEMIKELERLNIDVNMVNIYENIHYDIFSDLESIDMLLKYDGGG